MMMIMIMIIISAAPLQHSSSQRSQHSTAAAAAQRQRSAAAAAALHLNAGTAIMSSRQDHQPLVDRCTRRGLWGWNDSAEKTVLKGQY